MTDAIDSAVRETPAEFALYATAHAPVAQMASVLLDFPALRRFAQRIDSGEEEYMPSGPPMSPLTHSYFSNWSLYDLAVGLRKETLGQCALALVDAFGADDDFQTVISHLVDSRMGLLTCEAAEGEETVLRELVTGAEQRAVCASGHIGQPGELWFTRVLPPPSEHFSRAVVFGTPYVILDPGPDAWTAYFERSLPSPASGSSHDAYEQLMKRGPGGLYWHEYILGAYANHTSGAVFLCGVPDIAESRPHARVPGD